MASLLHPIVYLCIHAYLKGVDCGVCRKSSCTHWTVRSITGAASSCDVTLGAPPPRGAPEPPRGGCLHFVCVPAPPPPLAPPSHTLNLCWPKCCNSCRGCHAWLADQLSVMPVTTTGRRGLSYCSLKESTVKSWCRAEGQVCLAKWYSNMRQLNACAAFIHHTACTCWKVGRVYSGMSDRRRGCSLVAAAHTPKLYAAHAAATH
jgi:hypothetical protein